MQGRMDAHERSVSAIVEMVPPTRFDRFTWGKTGRTQCARRVSAMDGANPRLT